VSGWKVRGLWRFDFVVSGLFVGSVFLKVFSVYESVVDY